MTPERDERARPRPSPGSGEGHPEPKRGRLRQSPSGVAKALNYAESPAAVAMSVPPHSAALGPAAAAPSAVEPQSPLISSSRPRDDMTTPQAAPPKKRRARDGDAALEQRQQAVRQLGYDSVTAGGYFTCFLDMMRLLICTDYLRVAITVSSFNSQGEELPFLKPTSNFIAEVGMLCSNLG